MEKITIKNRKQEDIVVLVEESKENKRIVFLMHGTGYNKEEPSIMTIAKSFKQNGYTVIRFDTTNTFGESYGKLENATITNYYEDLEDVINWAETKEWYKEPFVLAGHSIGGFCIMLFAEKHPEKVKAIALISTFVSGKLYLEIHPKEVLDKWEKDGVLEWEDNGKTKRLGWTAIKDILNYDALKNISALTIPVLMIVGENDQITPVKHQKILYESIPGKKELNIIKGAAHMFEENNHLDEIKHLFNKWIRDIDNI